MGASSLLETSSFQFFYFNISSFNFKYLPYGYSPTDVYMHHVHAWYPQKPEGELDLLKQELQMVVSHQEGAVNQDTVVCKNSEHSNPLSSRLSS